MDKDGPKTHSGHPWIETHSGRSHQDRSSFTPSFSRWAFLIHSEQDTRSIFDDFNFYFGIFLNFSSLEESSSYSSSAQERNLTGFLYLAQAIRIEKRRPVDAAAGRRSPATTANNGASSNPATAIGIFGRIADEIVPAQFILQCSGIWRDVKTLRNTIHESRCEWLTLRFYHCHTTHTHIPDDLVDNFIIRVIITCWENHHRLSNSNQKSNWSILGSFPSMYSLFIIVLVLNLSDF